MSNLKKLVLISALSISFPVAGWSQNAPLLKSTDYLPPRIKQHRKFSFKRLVKHIAASPITLLTLYGEGCYAGGGCGYGYYPGYYQTPYYAQPSCSSVTIEVPATVPVNYPGIAGVGYQPLPDGSWIGPGNPGWHH